MKFFGFLRNFAFRTILILELYFIMHVDLFYHICRHLLAPCSSDEENDEKGKSIILLKEAETDVLKKAGSVMEVTWDVETTDEKVLDNKKKKSGEPTPWEKYLEKRKTKRKVSFFPNHAVKHILLLLMTFKNKMEVYFKINLKRLAEIFI